jgi:hypothetical protein
MTGKKKSTNVLDGSHEPVAAASSSKEEIALLQQRIGAALKEKADAETKLRELLRAQSDARRALALKNIDALLALSEHGCKNCSDEDPVNDYEDHSGPRCSRCALMGAKTSQYLEYDVCVTLKKACYDP